MNKHILSYTEKLNESIGRGSVLLIKGKPTDNGRYLYVTYIKGYAEIKPGIKMVFIGDQVWRVIHKGDGKFAGRKIDYRSEDSLKGVFNMKNPGKPSLVLNHNKTPFHWLTLNRTDIGAALKEIGPRLFSHELILESNQSVNINAYLTGELVKALTGRDSAVLVQDVIAGEDYDVDRFEEWAEEHDGESRYDAEWDATFEFIVDESKVPDLYKPHIIDERTSEEYQVMQNLGLGGEPYSLRMDFYTEVDVGHSYDEGDRWTPPSGDTEIGDPETNIVFTADTKEFGAAKAEYERLKIEWAHREDKTKKYPDNSDELLKARTKYFGYHFLELDEEEVDLTGHTDVVNDLSTLNKMMEGEFPSDIITGFKSVVGLGSSGSSNVSKDLSKLEYEYKHPQFANLTPEILKKWEHIKSVDIAGLETKVNLMIEEQKLLEERDHEESDNPLTEQEIARSNEITEFIASEVPNSTQYAGFNYSKGRHARVINHVSFGLVKQSFDALKKRSRGTDFDIRQLNSQYNKVQYEIKTNEITGRPVSPKLEKSRMYVNFFVNPADRI